VAEFSFRVWALGESMHPVPVPAPVTGDPPGAFDTSYWIAGRKGLGTSPVLDDLLDVTFIPNSSQEDLQAAVDSVGGEAVGGYKRLLGLSTYVVRIPADTSGATLLAALATLRSFGTVLLAMPIDARSGAARYREEEVARLRMSFPRARTKSDSAKFPNGVYKHLVRVTFRIGASPLAIQAAIDQVRGTMLECDIFTNWCVIRVPIDGTPTDLAHVVTALNAMPQVKRAGFELELTGMRP
jgi:hypothetical protein